MGMMISKSSIYCIYHIHKGIKNVSHNFFILLSRKNYIFFTKQEKLGETHVSILDSDPDPCIIYKFYVSVLSGITCVEMRDSPYPLVRKVSYLYIKKKISS